MRSWPRTRVAATLTATVLVAALAVRARPEPQPSERGPPAAAANAAADHARTTHLSRNPVCLDVVDLPATWDVRPGHQQNVKWVAELGSTAYGRPAIANGKIFVGTNNNKPRDPGVAGDKGVVMCFAETDGRFLSQAVHDKLAAGRVQDWPFQGVASHPAVVDGSVYYVSNRAEVVCAPVDGFPGGKGNATPSGAAGARPAWRFDMIKELDVFPHNLATGAPLVVDDRVFVVTGNGVDEGHVNIPHPGAPSFLALDRHTGRPIWQDNSPTARLAEARRRGDKGIDILALVNKGQLLMHGQWSGPVYAVAAGTPQVIFPGGDGWLYAFTPEAGRLLWKFDCNPKGAVRRLPGGSPRNHFVSLPVVHEGRLYVGVGDEPELGVGPGHLWCVDLERATALGRTNQGRDVSPAGREFDPAAPATRASALAWHYGGATREDDEDYQRNHYFGRTLSSCAVHDGLVYAAELGGVVHCLDARSGKHYWEHDMVSDCWCSPYWADGRVYVGNEAGQVQVFAHGRVKRLLGTVEMGGTIRVTPLAVGGVLYVVTGNPCRLYALARR
jgi:outer membrane protein assembly factor BamB